MENAGTEEKAADIPRFRGFRLRQRLWDRVDAAAASQGITPSDAIRQAITEYVTKQSEHIQQLNGMVEQLMNAHRAQIEQQIEAEAERFFASLPAE